MGLRVDSKSHVPVHVQLEEQIKHLILAGSFGPGERLPSIRELAGYLRINRNTVARVFSELEREGYVESRRGSGVYVLEPPVDEAEMRRQELLERVMELAAEQGVSAEDLGYALLARAGVSAVVEKVPVLFVECNEPELASFSAELEERLPVEVEGVLVDELEERVATLEELPWRLAVTTFYHVGEVGRVMEPRGIETVALLSVATIESLRRLAELPEGTIVGVVGGSRTCAENLLRSLEGAGLTHLSFYKIESSADVREGTRVVVCGNPAAHRLEELDLPKGVEVILQGRTLSRGGIELLGRMLRGETSRRASR
ncbi:GntR family transcriptional regulator [Rubrobacter calidifluminis]|uniref:GntR family transcriptional regulator n=1 Tax=Rubrobacter calidifluminis TaxID=1392640 RepID=UPI0023606C9B|nr:GntR family transcriptional regulator [Rubrobacter calidifluminis]